jgi:nickel superoxide dismutase
MRIDMIAEHIQTIEKSMNQIRELQRKDQTGDQQFVRWVDNKEQHANEIQHIVEQYFMTQRIKPVADTDSPAYAKYVRQLTLVHQMLIEAMKCKQTTDLTHVQNLRALLDAFSKAYFGDH